MGQKKAPSAPAAPDPGTTARTQSDMQFRANAVNQTTPFGSLTYTRDPRYDQWLEGRLAEDRSYNENQGRAWNEQAARQLFGGQNPYTEWSAQQTLSPAEQRQLDLANQAQELYGQAGVQQLQRLQGTFSQPFNPDSASRDRVEEAMFARINPQLERQRAGLETRLANQGIGLGTEAWRAAMDDYNRGVTDTRLGVVQAGGNEQTRQLQADLAVRNQPLNELAALLSGSQVQSPNFINTPQTNVDYQGAVNNNYAGQMAAYQQKVASRNADIGALASLAGTAASAGMMGFGGGFGFGGGMKAASPSSTWNGTVSYGMR